MSLVIFIYSMVVLLFCKYEPFWQEVSVESLIRRWTFRPVSLLFWLLYFFYAPEIQDRWAYCFCPVCHSVLLSETNLANNFLTVSARSLIFHMNISCDKAFPWVPLFFDCVTLTLEFDPFFDNFNLAHNFWTVSVRALIFHMNIPCDKTFPWELLFFTLWPWPWSLVIISK